jgi:hypothetical protein
MKARTATRIEWAMLAAASALFGSAVAFALYRLAYGSSAAAAIGGGGAFASCLAVLRKLDPSASRAEGLSRQTAVADLLAEADRSLAADATVSVSRVVRLFETSQRGGATVTGDASKALYDALADLRRTLR